MKGIMMLPRPLISSPRSLVPTLFHHAGAKWNPPPHPEPVSVSVCVCVILPGWRCQRVASGPSLVSPSLLITRLQCRVFLPFCIHLHFKMYIFLAPNVHPVGRVSITVLFLLRLPYLASPDV